MTMETLTEDERGALDWFGKQVNQTGRKALRIIDAANARIAELEGLTEVIEDQGQLRASLTAANARAEAAERANAQLRGLLSRLEPESESAALSAEVERLRSTSAANMATVADSWRASLAAANALLVIVRDDPLQQRKAWHRDVVAHLAAQPATAPTAIERGKMMERMFDDEEPTRTEACTVPPPGWSCSRLAGHDGPCAASPTRSLDDLGCPCGWCVKRADAEQRVLDAMASVAEHDVRYWLSFKGGTEESALRALATAELARRDATPTDMKSPSEEQNQDG